MLHSATDDVSVRVTLATNEDARFTVEVIDEGAKSGFMLEVQLWR